MSSKFVPNTFQMFQIPVWALQGSSTADWQAGHDLLQGLFLTLFRLEWTEWLEKLHPSFCLFDIYAALNVH